MRRRLKFPLEVKDGSLVRVEGAAATVQSLATLVATLPTSHVLNRRLGIAVEYNVLMQKALGIAAELKFQAAMYEPDNIASQITTASTFDDYTAQVTVFWTHEPVLEVQ